MNNVILSTRNIDDLINDIANQVCYRLAKQTDTAQPETANQWLNLAELCEYLPDRPAKQTIYQSIATIPHHKKGKKLYFLRSEIDQWLAEGKRYTQSEVRHQVDKFLANQ